MEVTHVYHSSKVSDNKSKASQFMGSHNEWIKQGFDDGVFLLVGSHQPNLDSSVIAHNVSLSVLHERVNTDPFVVEDIVKAEIIEISPAKADKRLGFLIG